MLTRSLIFAGMFVYSGMALAQTAKPTPIADIVRGNQVMVEGTVERIVDEEEFFLVDTSGTVEVYTGPTVVPVTVGERLSVSGFVDGDPGPIDVCASSISRADGTVIAIANCDG